MATINKYCTVGEFRKATEGLPDNTPLLLPGSDHSYHPGRPEKTEAAWSRDGGYAEYYGDVDLEPGEEKITAVVIS